MRKRSRPYPARLSDVFVRLALFWLLPGFLAVAQMSGPATSVPLLLPSTLAYDAAGNLYIADTASHVIRKVDTAGNLTTIAGDGVQGFSGDGGSATHATLDSPQGLAVDGSGNLYIGDTHNQRIRMLSAGSGVLTTVAGTGTAGFSGDGGAAVGAQLDLPTALAVDAAGYLYFADSGNNRIRRVNLTTGAITTIAGTGTQGYSGDNGQAAEAAIDSPAGIALDSAGNLYLADTHNHRVRRIAGTGIISTVAGTGVPGYTGDNEIANSSALALPHGLAMDAAGNLYIADSSNSRIRRVALTTGTITTVVGTGTQGYMGDNGPAVSAALDTPRAVTLAGGTLVTLADTGNQRVRQLTAQPAASTTIQTIAGLAVDPAVLTLSAPASVVYGAGSLIATLASPTAAAGSITFLDLFNGVSTSLGSSPLSGNLATFDTAGLAAGTHTITALYAGDAGHAAAQSPGITLTVTPQTVTAGIPNLAILYGQAIPALTGTITGVLPQDAASVTVAFATSASALSPVGTYPITVALSGASAGNYRLSAAPATLTIGPTSTVITLNTAIATATSGTAIPVTAHVASSTSGTPTGSITILDSSTPVGSAPVNASGSASFSLTTLAQGNHTLTAFYSGDADFTQSLSAAATLTVGASTTAPPPTPDFSLSQTGVSTQSIVPGSSASYTFTVQMKNGTLSSPITLAASGLPALATASFNPAYLPPGGPATFTLTIATPVAAAGRQAPSSIGWAVLFLPMFLWRPRSWRRIAAACSLMTLLIFAGGCGDRVNTAASSSAPPQSFTVTVTGTATTAAGSILQHAATVTLILQTAS